MLYILDEPTTGLHFKDINNLKRILNKLIDNQHSIIVIEHNTEIICFSDWIIDIGPESGNDGGEVIAVGTPTDIKQNPASITGRFL